MRFAGGQLRLVTAEVLASGAVGVGVVRVGEDEGRNEETEGQQRRVQGSEEDKKRMKDGGRKGKSR